MDKKQISEIINELGEENFSYDPVSVPIYQTSSFLFGSFDELKRAVSSEKDAYLYTRGNNPTCEVVEKKIAALENGEKAKLFASGVAAISASVMSLLKTGDHVVCVRDCYSWSYKLFSRYLSRFGIEVTFIDGVNITDWKNSIRSNTKLFYLESPTTFTFFLQDLTAVSNLAKENKIKTIIDNTWATPIFQNPLQFGIDLVVHSCSKYIGGHSDVVAGVVVGNTKEIEHIFNTELLNIGGIISPFNSWLLLRGLRTLPVRMKQHQENTLKIIEYLSSNKKISEIRYPLYQDHPQYELAKQQMSGASGLFSIKIKTSDTRKIRNFTDALRHFKIAASWGGYESLIIPAAALPLVTQENMNLIRFHVGLEEAELLIEDLSRALKFV